jgi:hypothetical protein
LKVKGAWRFVRLFFYAANSRHCDPSLRNALQESLYRKAQARLIELVPDVPAFESQVLVAHHGNVHVPVFDSSHNVPFITSIWMEPGKNEKSWIMAAFAGRTAARLPHRLLGCGDAHLRGDPLHRPCGRHRGASRMGVLFRHALRHALTPLVTLSGYISISWAARSSWKISSPARASAA